MARPRYTRAVSPPPLHFQPRDGELLHAIYERDGVLAKRQIKDLFWPQATQRAMEMRLSLLYHQGYLDWPTLEQWQTKPVTEPVCWLGWRGILWLADEHGWPIEPPRHSSENQLRRLAHNLHEGGLRWVREPRWSQLAHDLAIVDVRLAVERAVSITSGIRMEKWVNEGEFLIAPDIIEYQVSNGAGRSQPAKRQVRPDGYFALVDETRLKRNLPARARFLLEVDWGTHDLGSFAREKLGAGMAYLRSDAYRVRFGDNAGRWLIVTKAEQRLDHLRQQAERVDSTSAGTFLFTTLERVKSSNILADPIWQPAGSSGRLSLLAR
jgi:hypothetical protein